MEKKATRYSKVKPQIKLITQLLPIQFFKYLLVVYLLCQFTSLQAQNLIVGTYNLRYDNPRDTGNLWVNRAPVVASLIRFHDFDILGTQEGLLNQLEDISKQLPEYQRYGIGRNDGKDAGEHSA